MDLISDILLMCAALGAALYCHVLARRLRRLQNLKEGIGGAVASLSVQVEGLTKALKSAQKLAGEATETVSERTKRAEQVADRLELLVASMHDLETKSRSEERV